MICKASFFVFMIQPLQSRADEALLELVRLLRESGYDFTTPTPATHARVNARPENALAHDLRGVFGWSRPFAPDILPPAIWDAMQRAEIAVQKGETWKSTLRLSSLAGAWFFHSAFPTSDADSVFFGPDTYRFANAIGTYFTGNSRPVSRAVDIGCGAGPGAILAARAKPDAPVFAVDINPSALRLTQLNAALNQTPNVEARESNLLSGVDGDFDLIVANPPYLVDESKRAYRHGGGPLGAGLSLAIVDAALERLSPGGTLLLYTGAAMVDGSDPFQEALSARFSGRDFRWSYRETDPDIFGEELDCPAYARADRIAAVVLRATKAV